MGALFIGAYLFIGIFLFHVVGGVFYYKVIKHSKKSISKILDEDL